MCLEVDAVPRYCNACDLRPDVVEPVIIHDDPSARRIDMDVRRGDVRRRYLRMDIMGELDTRRFEPGLIKRELLGRSLRRLGQEAGFLELQATGRINRP